MTSINKATHSVRRFKRSKCKKCRSIFPLSKAIYIQKGDNMETYCSKDCLPGSDCEILNCSVCNLVVEQSSIFCMECKSWTHQQCSKLTDDDISALSATDVDWIYFPCEL